MWRRLLTFVAAVQIANSCSADIPPPPPDIPGTDIVVPDPSHIALAGILIASGILAAGLVIARGRSRTLRTTVLVSSLIVLAALAGALVYSVRVHGDYRKARDNWRPNGPVEEFDLPATDSGDSGS